MKNISAIFITLFYLAIFSAPAQEIEIEWKPRPDLNVSLPASVQMFEGNGILADGEPIRAFYATIDLTDDNLKLRVLGSNTHRQTTKEAYDQHDGILAINGGYFSGNTSVSLLISDGEVISPGLTHEVPRGAFGIVAGKPEIFWTRSKSANSEPLEYDDLSSSEVSKDLEANQAVGGGPVLVQNGEIEVYSEKEGFGGSHVLRHPRSAIGYRDESQLIMMVVDGRQKASAGVTLPELAYLMKSLGAKEAVNLDGGGSSALVAADEVVNIPADTPGGNRNSLRKNASALVLSERIPSEENETHIFDTESSSYKEHGLWKDSNLMNYYGRTPSRSTSASIPYNRAIYTLDEIHRKKYQVAAWWAVSDNSNTDSAAFIIHQHKKSDTVIVDQKDLSTSGRWNILGEFLLGPKDSIEITGTGKDGKLVTDAVRLVAQKDSPTLPIRGDVRIAVISDLNSGLGSASYEWQVDSIMKRIPRLWQPDLVISGGDMVAGMGISDTVVIRKMWAGFEEHIAKPLKNANIPYAFTLGNHDGPRSYELERRMTAEYWQNPENTPDLNFVDKIHFPHYYSFLKNGLFFVSWDASSSNITEENLNWVEEQFQTPEAKNAEMRFVLGHMPLYSVAQERDSKGNVLANPERLQALLEKYDVHTYVSGHQHAFYPGKRGDLNLLNTGAAGSGPRRWLGLKNEPVNTITIMDVFKEQDSIAYTTYDIRKKAAEDMEIFDEKILPSVVFGVNGHVIRRDIALKDEASGEFSTFNSARGNENGTGNISAKIEGDVLTIRGDYSKLDGSLIEVNPVTLFKGRNTEEGDLLKPIKVKTKSRKKGVFEGKLKLNPDLKEYLATGAIFVLLKTSKGELRAQLYPVQNQPPPVPSFTSHDAQDIYAVRDIEALYEVAWENIPDRDGDFLSYTYQLAKDNVFENLIFQQKTGRTAAIKMTEQDWFKFLEGAAEGEPVAFYHRIITSDGKNITIAPATTLKLMKSNQPLDDFIEVAAPNYQFVGKIQDAEGAAYGAEWDHDGKLWLADYGGRLIVKKKDGSEADFSPLKSVDVKGRSYDLRPINGIGFDLDGNILVGRNRHLIKIDAKTGKGIAVWEVPEGERAITAPRANQKGEIYAMSLFGDDPNYVLKQNSSDPASFDLIRTLDLKDRILSRTFDMSKDGKILYFPDPGSPVIQKYFSDDGITYSRGEDITSIASGSSAIQVMGNNRVYSATRASGISPSTFHFRDQENQRMWTLELPEVEGAEPRGIGVSPDEKTLIFGSWDKGGGFYKYVLKE